MDSKHSPSPKADNAKKSANVELTLQDLTKIALGAPELTSVNIAALHSLLEMLLKKLNCQNETVTLDDCACIELNEILAQSQKSPLAFNDETLTNIDNQLQSIKKLQKRINVVDTDLRSHLERSLPCQKKYYAQTSEATIKTEEWSNYGCEEICTLCLENFGHNVACHFLQHNDLLRNLLRRISQPIVDRVIYFEEKVERLDKAFTKFMQKVEEANLKLTLIHTCITEMEQLRIKMNENHSQFLTTMEEVQDMLDSKVDKLHMPAQKQYFQERFRNLERNFRIMEDKKRCPRVSGFIDTGVRCVSCGSEKIGANVDNEVLPMFPDYKSKPRFRRKKCVCEKHFLSAGSKTSIAPTLINFNDTLEFKKKKEPKKRDECPSNKTTFTLIEGSNGQFFRKG